MKKDVQIMSDKTAPWYIFRKNDILVTDNYSFPLIKNPSEIGLQCIASKVTSFDDNRLIHWAEVKDTTEPPEDMKFVSRRELLDVLGEECFAPAGVAFHYMDWTRKNLYCGRCATPMEDSAIERCRICPNCGNVIFPVICPAIIVAIEKEGKILLARNSRFPKGRYSVLAGFVEPGESLEDTVKREVMEEVSIEVDRIRYFGSQPWPFPHSLMLGFTAEWESGEICVDGIEIAHADWFGPDELPNTPSTRSISGRLIRNFIQKQTSGNEENTESIMSVKKK